MPTKINFQLMFGWAENYQKDLEDHLKLKVPENLWRPELDAMKKNLVDNYQQEQLERQRQRQKGLTAIKRRRQKQPQQRKKEQLSQQPQQQNEPQQQKEISSPDQPAQQGRLVDIKFDSLRADLQKIMGEKIMGIRTEEMGELPVLTEYRRHILWLEELLQKYRPNILR
jgi:hypothetical protein